MEKKIFFLASTGSAALCRMFRPLVTHLYLLCLDVSVSIILIALNISLTRIKFLHIIIYFFLLFYNFAIQRDRRNKTPTCLVFAVPKFLIYMSYSLTGGRSNMEKVIEKSSSIRRSSSVQRFLEPDKTHTGRIKKHIHCDRKF